MASSDIKISALPVAGSLTGVEIVPVVQAGATSSVSFAVLKTWMVGSSPGSFVDITYTGLLTGGTGVVNLGSGQFYKDANGNIGLGTATPTNYAGRANLQVNGSTGGNLSLSVAGTEKLRAYTQAGGSNIATVTGTLDINTGDASALSLSTNSVSRLTISNIGDWTATRSTVNANYFFQCTTSGNEGSITLQPGNASFGGPVIDIQNSAAGVTGRVAIYIRANQMLFTAIGAAHDFVFKVSGGNELMRITTVGHLQPGIDNTQTCGTASNRFSVVYAGNGAINTSDARVKTSVSPLTSKEIAAATALAKEIGTFQFLDAVAAKGADRARLHVGMTVQRAMGIMGSFDLDPLRYGFICHDVWDEKIEEESPGVSRVAVAAGDRYGFRPDQLLLFIARGFEARLAALEARVGA